MSENNNPQISNHVFLTATYDYNDNGCIRATAIIGPEKGAVKKILVPAYSIRDPDEFPIGSKLPLRVFTNSLDDRVCRGVINYVDCLVYDSNGNKIGKKIYSQLEEGDIIRGQITSINQSGLVNFQDIGSYVRGRMLVHYFAGLLGRFHIDKEILKEIIGNYLASYKQERKDNAQVNRYRGLAEIVPDKKKTEHDKSFLLEFVRLPKRLEETIAQHLENN